MRRTINSEAAQVDNRDRTYLKCKDIGLSILSSNMMHRTGASAHKDERERDLETVTNQIPAVRERERNTVPT